MLARDTAPIGALADSLAGRGLEVTAIFVASLKDADSIAFVRAELSRDKPDVIVNTTGFRRGLKAKQAFLTVPMRRSCKRFLPARPKRNGGKTRAASAPPISP